MTYAERASAWGRIPKTMRTEITDLINSNGISYNTQKRLMEIFGFKTNK